MRVKVYGGWRDSMNLIEAVRELRKQTSESQQAFATRLGISIRAIANYEKDRAPTGKALATLAALASEVGRGDLAYIFASSLEKELNLKRIRGLIETALKS